MQKLKLVIFSLLLCWVTISIANSSSFNHHDFDLSDFNTVSDAVDAIKKTLEDQGLEVIAVLDHAANAKNVDLELPPTQLILFRDYRSEKRLLRRNHTAVIDLPMKILVWEDTAEGKIKLFYNTAGYLSERHALNTRDHILSRLNRKLKQFGKLDNGLITINSVFSVEETVKNLKKVLLDNGFFIPFTFDFSGEPFNHRQPSPSQLIIFGNPKVGSPLMQNQQSIGLDLPQKFLVWEDNQGQVHITYNDPKFLGKRHGLQGLDTVLGNIANRLSSLANEGAGIQAR